MAWGVSPIKRATHKGLRIGSRAWIRTASTAVNSLMAQADENEREADLKESEKEHSRPVRRARRGFAQEGQAQQRGQDVAQEDGFDSRRILLLTQ